MSAHDEGGGEGELLEAYRRASESETLTPSQATRAAILAEGARVAAARAKNPHAHRFDTRQPAANQPRWRLAVFGTFGAVLLGAVLMFPYWHGMPERAAMTADAPAPVPAVTAEPSPPAAYTRDAQATQAPAAAARQANAMPSKQGSPPARERKPSPALASDKRREAEDSLQEVIVTQAPRVAAAAPPSIQGVPYAKALPVAPRAQQSAPAADASESLSITASQIAPLARKANERALVDAVGQGDTALVARLLAQGADSHEVDADGHTPLRLAVDAGRTDIVRMLLAHGADPNAQDPGGESPLQRARASGHDDIVALLVSAGAH